MVEMVGYILRGRVWWRIRAEARNKRFSESFKLTEDEKYVDVQFEASVRERARRAEGTRCKKVKS